MLKVIIGLFVLCWHSLPLQGIQFQVQPRMIKCIIEEVPPSHLVTIQYAASAVADQAVDLILRDEEGETFRRIRNITHGNYTFENHTSYRKYEICYKVIVPGHQQASVQSVSLTNMKTLKLEEHIYGTVQLGILSELELLANSIISDYALARQREEMDPKEKEYKIPVDTMFIYSTLCTCFLRLTLASIQVLFLCLYIREKCLKAPKNRVTFVQEMAQRNTSEEVAESVL